MEVLVGVIEVVLDSHGDWGRVYHESPPRLGSVGSGTTLPDGNDDDEHELDGSSSDDENAPCPHHAYPPSGV